MVFEDEFSMDLEIVFNDFLMFELSKTNDELQIG